MNIFLRESTNLGRQTEVDYLRGLTALYLIIIHIGLYLGSSDNTVLYTFCDILGSEFAAPIFMALMGISVAFSRHRKPMDMLKRGVRLFITGYALNLYRSIVPLVAFGAVDEWASVEGFFVVDILQFAGLTFMFLALLKKIKLPNIAILGISVAMVLLDELIMLPESVPWDSKILTGIVNLFCPVTGWSCFPFLTWFFFPAVGLVFGEILTYCADKKKMYAVLLPIGFFGIAYVYYQFYCLYPDYTSYYYGHNFYYMGLKNVLLTISFIIFSLAFCFFVGKILPSAVKRLLIFLSKNLNTFYIFTWIVISTMIHIQAIYKWNLGTATIVIIIALTEPFCIALTKLWLLITKRISH